MPTVSKLIFDFLISINPSLKYYDKIDKLKKLVIHYTLSHFNNSLKYIKADFMKFTFYYS